VDRLREALSPARPGSSFRWLLGSSWVSNIGDGIGVAAGPLLVASLTRDPTTVAMAVLLQRLPWLLFGLPAGVIADRLDRRVIVVVVDLLRAAVLAVLAVTIASGTIGVPLVLAVMFVVGTAETFADTTTHTLLPMLVKVEDLGVGNARLMAGFITGNQLVGPLLGAALFAAGAATPFALQASCVGLGALMIARIRATTAVTGALTNERPWRSVVAGFRWLWHHPPVRTLTIAIVAFNVTFGAAWSVLVLYAQERLGLGDVGFGVLLTTSAVGGLLGSGSYEWIERHFKLGNVMRVGLLIETGTHLALALTTSPAVAFVTLFVFGIHTALWGTIASSVRQRAVPTSMQGRVGSIYLMGVQGGLVVGAALGGVIAAHRGITAPYWFGFIGSAVILTALWRHLNQIAYATASG
jgi:MFS family permease